MLIFLFGNFSLKEFGGGGDAHTNRGKDSYLLS